MKSSTNKLRAPLAAFGANRNDNDSDSATSTAQGRNGALVGEKGKQYGLQVRQKPSSAPTAPSFTSGSNGVRAKLSVFAAASAEADRDSDTDEKRRRLMASGDAQKKKVISSVHLPTFTILIIGHIIMV